MNLEEQIAMRMITIPLLVSLVGAALPAGAQESKYPEKEIRLVGCVQWEKDYRKERNEGRGGAIGTGLGVGNEFVLTMVKPEGTRKDTAYSITGGREKELGRRIGQQIEVIGLLDEEGKAGNDKFVDLPRIKMTAWVPLKDFCPAN